MKTTPLALQGALILVLSLVFLPLYVISLQSSDRSDVLRRHVLPDYAKRASNPAGGSCPGGLDEDSEVAAGESSGDEDGSTTDGSGGIGVELETSKVKIEMNQLLTPEYWINGKTVKIGDNQAVPAARAIAKDFKKWKPIQGQRVTVDENPCTWRIREPEKKLLGLLDPDYTKMRFQPQLTAPMPLEAIQELIVKYRTTSKSAGWLFSARTSSPLIAVTKDFFQAHPLLKPADMEKYQDILGFFSLLVSWAKVFDGWATKGQSLKNLLPIMPRSDFISLYYQIRYKFSSPLDLYSVVSVLVCYKNDKHDTTAVLDKGWCDGDEKAPVPHRDSYGRTRLDLAFFGEKDISGEHREQTVKNWIDGITHSDNRKGRNPDLLTWVDQVIDGSIGGWGRKLERMYNSDRQVPLFEFRHLYQTPPDGFGKLIREAEKDIMRLHERYPEPPGSDPPTRRRAANLHTRRLRVRAPACSNSTISGDSTSGSSVTSSPASRRSSSGTVPAISLSTASSTSRQGSSITKGPMVSCSPFSDPDLDGDSPPGCICGTMTLPTLASTGRNTGTHYSQCNILTPSSAVMTSAASISNGPFFAVTTTDSAGKVIACQSLRTYGVDNIQYSECAGTSLTLFAPPSVTATIATLTHVNVGTLTAGVLYTSVSNALESICPTPVGNEMTSCNNKTFTIHDVEYWNGSGGGSEMEGPISRGELEVSAPISSYTKQLRSAIINTAAMTINSSAHGPACYQQQEKCAPERLNACVPGTNFTFCNAPELVEVNYWNAKHESNEDPTLFQLITQLKFALPDGGDFDCNAVKDGVALALESLAPEFTIFDNEIANSIGLTCDSIEDINNG
ncbi:hypothetical protein NA57DRAFT_60432 [Rhizodiscina lignyota]|uniref:Uncharacterized protein n=1 Tax=Rhizodiscina lignyota TaxID=1504668 RepID=A0A9P4I3H2_9PEZI|nr:hypothetical protein NA57DRAFT_60432 [Rhizodiscina lignyota]